MGKFDVTDDGFKNGQQRKENKNLKSWVTFSLGFKHRGGYGMHV